MGIKKAYHSCFLTDVQISDDLIRIMDSSKNAYYVNMQEKESVQSFKLWFKQIFLKALPQSVTVFEYEIRKIDDGETGVFIIKFLNVKDDTMINESQV